MSGGTFSRLGRPWVNHDDLHATLHFISESGIGTEGRNTPERCVLRHNGVVANEHADVRTCEGMGSAFPSAELGLGDLTMGLINGHRRVITVRAYGLMPCLGDVKGGGILISIGPHISGHGSRAVGLDDGSNALGNFVHGLLHVDGLKRAT